MQPRPVRTRRLLIVWASMTGATRQLADAAAKGAARAAGEGSQPGSPAGGAAAAPALEVVLRQAPQADASDLLAADGYLFATPENLASMSGLMKDFFDRSYYAALDRIAGRPYAAIVCAGSDGEGAARQLARIATGLRLRAVAEPLVVVVDAQTPERILYPKRVAREQLARAQELGEAIGTGLTIGLW